MLGNISVSRKGFAAFAIMAAIAIATCSAIYFRSVSTATLVEHKDAMANLLNETGTYSDYVNQANLEFKSFLLTGNRDHLAEYTKISDTIDAQAGKLAQLYKEQLPAQVTTLEAANAALKEWRTSVIDRQIKLMRDPMTVELARTIETTDTGARLMAQFLGTLKTATASLEQAAADASSAQRAALSSMDFISLMASFIIAAVAGVMSFLNFRLVSRPLGQLADATERLAGGDLTVQIHSGGKDEIGRLASAMGVFHQAAITNKRLEAEAEESRRHAEEERIAAQEQAEAAAAERLRVATSGLAAGLQRLAKGDLSFQITETFAPDFEALRHDFNQSVSQLATTLSAVSGSIAAMESGTREIAEGTNDLSRRTEQQAASLEETAAAVEEITSNVQNSTKRTEEARSVASAANQSALQSAKVVTSAEDAMRKIENSSQQVTNIIGVIDEIAFQTNLLALNAGVEAARAGEAGKGFAVVAQEVRELAQRSANAAKEIKQLISASTTEVSSGVDLVRQAGESLRNIGSLIVEINDHMDAIAVSAREQSTGLAEVNQAVNSMDQTTQQNAAMVEQSNAASAALAGEAAKLRDLVSQFTLNTGSQSQAQALRSVARSMAAPSAPRAPVRTSAPAARPAPVSRGNTAVAQDSWEEF